MKTFATNGTGNQQTLVELESEKIPVYEDLADAESDLTNLEEGQLLATKDTGSELSAPVDVVQSGNMHAVSSNAVAESLSYSTTEQATGGKWIDGKPIYKITINFGAYTGGWEYKAWDKSAETIVNYYGMGYKAGVNAKKFPNLDNYMTVSPTQVAYTDSSSATFDHVIVTIEYTKTTD